MGGTWDLFRYPGIRSDSDMHTLGYSFKPWREAKAIADGPSILKLRARRPPPSTASTSTSATGTWRRSARLVERGRRLDGRGACAADTGETVRFTCNFLFMCAGYYSYRQGYTPEFDGHRALPGHDHPSRSSGPRTSTTRASRSW